MKNTMSWIEVSPLTNPSDVIVKVPGSKSYCQRALLIAALCEKHVEIKNMLESNDTRAMRESIAALQENRAELMIHESGLTARFITALACISPGTQTIKGTPNLQKRPIKDLVDALRQLGADIEYADKEGFLPITISSENLSGSKVSIAGHTSSQYLSALLLIAPTLQNGLEITVEGEQISKPYIDITLDIMASFGVSVENNGYQQYIVKPQKYRAVEYEVEGDYSSAAYFYAINALSGSNVKVENLNPDSKQGDKKFVDLLKDGLPQDINAADFPDQAMTSAVLAAFKQERTMIRSVKSLRIKETERIKALENELAKMGIRIESTEDSLTIYGGKPSGALVDSYNDHRIAMSFAVAGCKAPRVRIMNPKAVNKTFPGFWKELSKVTGIKEGQKSFSNILLIGMRGSGKTTVGKILSEKLGKRFLDMDIYLEKKYGQKVRDIVLQEGWEQFRKLESETCREISKEQDCVISSGGGIVLDQKNMELLKPNSASILLRAEPGILTERIKHDRNRPELSRQPSLLGELDEVWEERKYSYYKNADFVIDTGNLSLDQAVEEIMEKLK